MLNLFNSSQTLLLQREGLKAKTLLFTPLFLREGPGESLKREMINPV